MPQDILGIRFAFNVAIATAIVWYSLKYIADTNPIWAIASMVAASDPQVNEAARMFRSRLTNVVVGGVVGLLFLRGRRSGRMDAAVRACRDRPAVVLRHPHPDDVAAGADHGRDRDRLRRVVAFQAERPRASGLHKVGEVVFGCVVGLVVSWAMSRIWPIRRPADLSGP